MFKMKQGAVAMTAILVGSPMMASAAFNTDGFSSEAAYLVPTANAGWTSKAILTTGDSSADGYVMGGIPDGLGAFDNNDGTFTVLMNQEYGSGAGVNGHGVLGAGAYVSKLVIDKSTLQVVKGSNLITHVVGWDSLSQSSSASISTAFNRFCSADLPSLSGLSYTDGTGTTYGTTERLFMNGEEGGANGRAVATVVSTGDAFILGKFNTLTNGTGGTDTGAWENILINPYSQMKTVAMGNNDGGTGIMANALEMYVGTKTTTGSEVDKAGLTNGVTKFINVMNVAGQSIADEITNNATQATDITDGMAFTLSDTESTHFARPEDGVWSLDGSKYFFVTTNQLDKTELNGQTQVGRSRLWELDFTDISNPELGGNIKMLLDGTEGQNMLDNMTISADGSTLILQEDTGNADHSASIWSYDFAADSMTKIFKHDSALFGDVVNGVAVAGSITKDEESSAVIDISSILGYKAYLLTTQNHAKDLANPSLVEGGQLQVVRPVPVPGAVWLFGSAIMGFLGLKRRKA